MPASPAVPDGSGQRPVELVQPGSAATHHPKLPQPCEDHRLVGRDRCRGVDGVHAGGELGQPLRVRARDKLAGAAGCKRPRPDLELAVAVGVQQRPAPCRRPMRTVCSSVPNAGNAPFARTGATEGRCYWGTHAKNSKTHQARPSGAPASSSTTSVVHSGRAIVASSRVRSCAWRTHNDVDRSAWGLF